MMAKRNTYPGGFKLTLKSAREVAMQEFGTARGLQKDDCGMPGSFTMEIENLYVRIHPDTYGETGCIVVSAEMAHGTGQSLKLLDPETLQENFDALERYICQSKRDVIKEWVDTYGAAFCRSQIDFLSD